MQIVSLSQWVNRQNVVKIGKKSDIIGVMCLMTTDYKPCS